ncbi:MAG: ester cyclase [Candidatus Riflebacteria bacterium]|nr:ester cyclase [Candidatus Riflebacteria bacterium]
MSRARHDLASVAERWMREIWAQRNLASFDELHAPDFFDRSPSGRGSDRNAYRAGLEELFTAFPDFEASTEDLVVDEANSKVAVRWTAVGTHRGEFLGCPPTGRHITFRGIEILRIEKGMIVERWGEWDGLDLVQQLRA